MKPETLKQFKQQARKLSNLYEKLEEHWNGELKHGNNATYPVTVLVNVLLKNIAFDGSDCVGYNHEKEVKSVEKQIQILREINEYENKCYMTHYPYSEVSSLYHGLNMFEDDEQF